MTELILELKAVIFPTSEGDAAVSFSRLVEVATAFGTVTKREATPYSKPPDSLMLRVQAVCIGRADDLVSGILERLQGTGWIVNGNDIESEAIWSPRESMLTPTSPILTWAFVQAFPASSKIESGELQR